MSPYGLHPFFKNSQIKTKAAEPKPIVTLVERKSKAQVNIIDFSFMF